MAAEAAPLPEVAAVPWRPRLTAQSLRRRELLWTGFTLGHVVPFLATAGLLVVVEPLAFAVAAICLVHAWILPALYAQRGANVLRAPRRAPAGAERVAAGLLGDLVDHEARELHAATGAVTERGALGVWVVGPAGAVLVRPGGRRVACWCVRVADPDLPTGDRIAHLLLALRADEAGFATVANLAFSGASWRLRRRLPRALRPALARAVALAA